MTTEQVIRRKHLAVGLKLAQAVHAKHLQCGMVVVVCTAVKAVARAQWKVWSGHDWQIGSMGFILKR